MRSKTVYVLGAGFSVGAGAPAQNKIISEVFKVAREHPGILHDVYIADFREFLTDTLLIPAELHSEVPLEDVFTPLDRCVIDNINFRNLTVSDIKTLRGKIYFLISKTLEFLLRDRPKKYIDQFAKHIVEECQKRRDHQYPNIDPVSIISTNWDILLDTSLKDAISLNSYEGVVDYCCHVSSYDSDDTFIKPGLEVLGKGGYNVKLIKLHGSLNWLQCPRCLRNYVNMASKIATSQYERHVPCRHCDDNFGPHPSHELISNLTMPTFLKDFTNPQYKLIWQNAGIELAEADSIVFIGYSLPYADFEMRQLLARMVRDNAKIEVVDFGRSATAPNIEETTKRYEVFFGRRLQKPIHWKGAEAFIKERFHQAS